MPSFRKRSDDEGYMSEMTFGDVTLNLERNIELGDALAGRSVTLESLLGLVVDEAALTPYELSLTRDYLIVFSFVRNEAKCRVFDGVGVPEPMKKYQEDQRYPALDVVSDIVASVRERYEAEGPEQQVIH